MLYLFLLVALLIPLMAVILDSRLGQALAARLEREPRAMSSEDRQRLQTLEGEVERLTDEVRRLRDQGEFLERLVGERRAGEIGPASEASLPPRDPSGGPDGRP